MRGNEKKLPEAGTFPPGSFLCRVVRGANHFAFLTSLAGMLRKKSVWEFGAPS